MKQSLIFEISQEGRRTATLPKTRHHYEIPEEFLSTQKVDLPEIAEIDLVRHYTALSNRTHGVDNVFYPLGSCTMKYNPKLNEVTASQAGFSQIHPLQPEETVSGAMKAMGLLQDSLCAITGMDAFTLEPAVGAQGEFTGMLMIRAYHNARNDLKRHKVIIPDSAHGTNPASAVMAGYQVVSVPSSEKGGIDIEALRGLIGEDTAALMLTNPNTLGLFDENVKLICDMIHDVGGLLYYDGANMNAIMGLSRPGDMGFDVVHLNLHKTFSTPHGGGGPGSGPVGVKEHLIPFLPDGSLVKEEGNYKFLKNPKGIGRVRSFYGNFLVNMRALTYILSTGADGLYETSKAAVINANYMMRKLEGVYKVFYPQICMHEFVVSLEDEKEKYGFTAKDIAKALLDYGIHPPTMYFPNVVSEALMIEPNDTESKETIDEAIRIFIEIYEMAKEDPKWIQNAPYTMPVTRVDDVTAARNPILVYSKTKDIS